MCKINISAYTLSLYSSAGCLREILILIKVLNNTTALFNAYITQKMTDVSLDTQHVLPHSLAWSLV